MSTEKVQRAVDSIQLEQDVLYQYFRAHQLLKSQHPEVDDDYFFYHHADSLYLMTQNQTRYNTWAYHWSLDSLKSEPVELINDSLADALTHLKKSFIKAVDSTQLVGDSLTYDKIIYPSNGFYKVYYLAEQEKDSVFSLGVDYYFLLSRTAKIIMKKQFHDKVKHHKLFDRNEVTRTYSPRIGFYYMHKGQVPFIYATNIVKARWYKTEYLEFYGENSRRNKRTFYYHFKDNEITFNR